MWEYKMVRVRWDGLYRDPDGSADFNRHITELGKVGWELGKVIASDDKGGYVVFRRPYMRAGEQEEPSVTKVEGLIERW